MNTYACVVSTLFGMVVVCFPNVMKTLLCGFDPYIMFYLRCECPTFLDTHTHRNAVKHSIEISLSYMRKGTFMKSLQL